MCVYFCDSEKDLDLHIDDSNRCLDSLHLQFEFS